MDPVDNYFAELNFQYPPYYAIIIQDISARHNLRIRIETSGQLDFPNATTIIKDRNKCIILVPDFTTLTDPKITEIQRRSIILSACLVLGHELAHLAIHYPQKLPYGAEREALDFSVRAAMHAGLFGFDSEILYEYLGKSVPALLEHYLKEVFSSSMLPFTISNPSVTTHQLYEILRHTNRACTLLSLIYSAENHEYANILRSLEVRMSRYSFELDRVHVASPGSFLLTLKKGYDTVKKVLPKVRKTLKTAPFLDMYIQEAETGYVARIEGNLADAEEAKTRQTKARIERKVLERVEENLEIAESLEAIGLSGGGITEKLIESSQVLRINNVKPSD